MPIIICPRCGGTDEEPLTGLGCRFCGGARKVRVDSDELIWTKEVSPMQSVKMFKCLNCQYEGGMFDVSAAGIDIGAFTYKARCPKCGSNLVNTLPGTKVENMTISIWPGELRLTDPALPCYNEDREEMP